MPALGSTAEVTLTVDEYDNTTVATLVATAETGAPVNPTVSSSDGRHTWSGLLVYDRPGWWILSWTVTGAGAGKQHERVYVDPAPLPALPDLAALRVYLGQFSASWADPELQSVLDAETAAQRAVCRIPAVYPADLGEALKRRVSRNLAMRNQPLAVLTGDAEAGSTAFLPGSDPEVRRLEGPYRPVVFG